MTDSTVPLPDTQSSHQSIIGGCESMSTKKGSQYVYYRLYTKDGPIKTQHPIDTSNPFIGHTLARFVAPPHTAASLKRHLCYIEGLASSDAAKLFAPLSSLTAKDDSARLSLLASSGPGLSPQEPMALVFGGQEPAGAIQQSEELDLTSSQADLAEIRYIYYRLYSLQGVIKSKLCFDGNDVFLGRLETLSIPPPQVVASLATRIASAEGLVIQDTPTTEEIQIYRDIGSEAAMWAPAALSLTEDTYLGNSEDDPVAVVYQPRSLPNPAVVPGHCDPSWFSIMPTDALRTNESNTKKFYLLPINGTIELKAALKADEVIIFQSVGFKNMESCVSHGYGVWIVISSASDNVIMGMYIRPSEDYIIFNGYTIENRWGSEQHIPLKGLFKGPNPTITIYDHGDRYQIMIEYVTVAYFVKRIKESGVVVKYGKDPIQENPFSNTLAVTTYTSFADVITRVIL